MQVFYFIAAFLLVNRIAKSLKFSPLLFKWKSILVSAQWALLGIYLLFVTTLGDSAIPEILSSGILLGVVWYIGKEEDFKNFKAYVQSHYPLIVVGFIAGIIRLISSKFFEEHDEYFALAIVAAFVYIFGRWATYKKQDDELKFFSQRNSELDRMVAERTAELTNQKNELEKTLEQLQTTQQQLIQSEKLASLGELTAGIAHEIQNPLNFVNNFSEVSMELVDEMEQELNNGDKEEAMAIAADIKQNLEKIRHHGQRADGIVKGMLQHSRASSNVKEPADINKLADEYLRLAYHGLRAKDKSFNCELETHFAENLPLANMVPQDVGRVLLNLFNNAFYAVQHKKKTAGDTYRPIVKVTTAINGKNIEVRVHDNGIGIPDSVKDKILQPFFTTKPTGEGTGLGLSLSYDIIAKGHHGSINIQSVEGESTEFTILIPA
jgi:two-component system NtrC family sensor kinase